MSAAWVTVIAAGAGTMVLKAIGPLFVGGRRLPPRLAEVADLLAPAVLAGLVVTQAVGGDRAIVLDERLAGVGAAVIALRFRAPLLLVVVVAAVVTALVRAL